MSNSAEVMAAMNKLVGVREISETMANMAREMERSGLIESVIGDALDSMDADGIDSAADLEVERIVQEITGETFKSASAAPTAAVKNANAATTVSATGEEANGKIGAEEQSATTNDLLSRLQAL